MDRSEAKWRAQQLVARMTVSEKMTQLRYDSPACEGRNSDKLSAGDRHGRDI